MERLLSDIPAFETERLCLRPLGLGDAEAFRILTDDPAITEAVDFLCQPFGLTDAEKLLRGDRDGRDCFWGVWRRGDSLLIGTVGTHLADAAAIEIGYWFANYARGFGLASEAVAGVISVLVQAYPERQIIAECRPQNEASWRLLERSGFRADGAVGARPGRKRLILVG